MGNGSFGQRGFRHRPAAGPKRRRGAPPLSRHFGFVAFFAMLAVMAVHQSGIATKAFAALSPGTSHLLAAPEPKTPAARGSSIQFGLCGSGARRNCVVDGDTLWMNGEKIRVADINTPEVSQPACDKEARLAAKATRRFRELLNAGPFEVRQNGRDEDRYGRKLRTLHRDGRSLGDVLVSEGLAEAWTGAKGNWCA